MSTVNKAHNLKPEVFIGGERTLNYSESNKSYKDLGKCHCDSCRYALKWEKCTWNLLFLGMLMPLLWVANVFILFAGLAFLEKKPTKFDSYIEMQNQKVYVGTEEISEESDNLFIVFHKKLRRKSFSKLGYCLISVILYSFFMFIIIYCSLHR